MKNWKRYSYLIALVIITGVFLFSTYRLVQNHIEETRINDQLEVSKSLFYGHKVHAAENNNREKETIVIGESEQLEETNQSLPPTNESFLPLLEVNSDINSWVNIDGIRVDFPVLQSDDNYYYLYKDLYEEDNLHGSVFMDYRNDIQGNTKHFILYGHNTATMFEDVLHYASRWNFENYNIIEFDTLYSEGQQWEIFSAYYTNIHDYYIQTDFESDEEYVQFLNHLQSKSLHSSDIELSKDDIILTLSTCTALSNDSRFAVHARLIK